MAQQNTFYVTTPIYYVNARPHLGSFYSTLLADVAKRWHMINGDATFFLTGTDEHGQKVAQTAQQHDMEPKAFVDSLVDTFTDVWDAYDLSYDRFIRTTDEYHQQAVQHWIRKLRDQGDIYKSRYEGWYSTASEMFLTEKDLDHVDDYGTPICPTSGKPATWVSEECYFFRLSAYQDKLLEFYRNNPDFITPAERMNEVVSFVQDGLKDLSISRTTIDWGIPFPDDPDHVTYVWADALNNYISAIGYGDPERQDEFNRWWPADLQIIGKDIVRFHAVYWPAFLMAAGLEMPKKLLVHGFIRVDNQKMSKSLGNVIDPQDLLEQYGTDPVRYHLTRYLSITQDSSLTLRDIENSINADLADDLGNLLNRVLSIATKHDYTDVQAPSQWGAPERELHQALVDAVAQARSELEHYYFHKAYAAIWKFINAVNRYIHEQEPWKVAKTDRERFEQIIAAACHSLYAIGVLLWPLMPNKMQELFDAIGVQITPGETDYVAQLCDTWNMRFTLTKRGPLFTKIDHKQEASAESHKTQAQDAQPHEQQMSDEPAYITIDQVSQVDLRIGTIKTISDIQGSHKLYKLTVDFGDETRTICAGIKQHYNSEELVGHQALFVTNLAPRKLMGVESQGMMLMAHDADNNPVMISPTRVVPTGSRLR